MFSAIGTSIGVAAALAQAQAQQEFRRAEEQLFAEYLETLPPEDRPHALAERQAQQERERREALEERRHRELCESIRASRLSVNPSLLAFGLGWIIGNQ